MSFLRFSILLIKFQYFNNHYSIHHGRISRLNIKPGIANGPTFRGVTWGGGIAGQRKTLHRKKIQFLYHSDHSE